ncbi:MAG: hypothetical protein WBF93_22515 [Pirellulales bacterium]|nr:hypothetical protein [Pirellulales bacterium]
MHEPDEQSQKMMNAIMAAIFVWGCILALGVLLFRKSWPGAGIALACTIAFLSAWKLLLNSKRGKRDPPSPTGADDDS